MRPTDKRLWALCAMPNGWTRVVGIGGRRQYVKTIRGRDVRAVKREGNKWDCISAKTQPNGGPLQTSRAMAAYLALGGKLR